MKIKFSTVGELVWVLSLFAIWIAVTLIGMELITGAMDKKVSIIHGLAGVILVIVGWFPYSNGYDRLIDMVGGVLYRQRIKKYI